MSLGETPWKEVRAKLRFARMMLAELCCGRSGRAWYFNIGALNVVQIVASHRDFTLHVAQVLTESRTFVAERRPESSR